MSSGVEFNTIELHWLEIDLGRAPRRVRSPKGLRRASLEIAREMRVDAAGHKGNYFGKPGTEYAIGLDKHVSAELTGPTTAEIGIENKGSGSLGHIIAYGSVNNAPAYDPGAGPRRAMGRVLADFADHAEESVLGRRGR